MTKKATSGEESEEELLERERYSFWSAAFATGPDVVLMMLFFPAILALAAADGICSSFNVCI